MGLLTTPVLVRVPATSANLGPGFDALGLALGLADHVRARVTDGGITVSVTGEGAGDLPDGAEHLVAQTMLRTFELLGEKPPGLALECRNGIPQARGLGSSSAAIVAGILLARALVTPESGGLPDEVGREKAVQDKAAPGHAAQDRAQVAPGHAAQDRAAPRNEAQVAPGHAVQDRAAPRNEAQVPPGHAVQDRAAPRNEARVAPGSAAQSAPRNTAQGAASGFDDEAVLRFAAEIEGHPDNVAPCLLGNFTIAWAVAGGARAVAVAPHPDVRPFVFVPAERGLTEVARAALPPVVPHRDAAFNAGRSALLVHALTREPSLLFEATEDRLHQGYRSAGMPGTAALVAQLRADGNAAVVSGAGPAVLVLGGRHWAPPAVDGWRVAALDVDSRGACLLPTDAWDMLETAERDPVAAGWMS